LWRRLLLLLRRRRRLLRLPFLCMNLWQLVRAARNLAAASPFFAHSAGLLLFAGVEALLGNLWRQIHHLQRRLQLWH
jgi:hypothetical protein